VVLDILGGRMRGLLLTALLIVAASTPAAPSAVASGTEATFIVVLTAAGDDAQAAAVDIAESVGDVPLAVFDSALDGFAVVASAAEVARIADDPRVAYIEADRVVRTAGQTTPTGIERAFASSNTTIDIDGVDDIRVDVDVAVIDTGVDLNHPDLNVVGGVTCTSGPVCVSGGDDDHYHGTHVAGTIGALDNGIGVVGVAPGARLWSVKVLNSSGAGTISSIIRGLDWVTAHSDTIDVVNMSIGADGFSQAFYDAVQGAVDNGVAFAVAAGNEDVNANQSSPASFDNVLTVSALADFDGRAGGLGSPTCRSDQDDTLADFSNWGAVDIAAPGTCIASTLPRYMTAYGGYGVVSGTSMAAPHVAGALALLAGSRNATSAAEVGSMYEAVLAAGNRNWTDDSGDGVTEPLLDLSNAALFHAASVCAAVSSSDAIGSWSGNGTRAGIVGGALSGEATFGAAVAGQGFVLAGENGLTLGNLPTVSNGVSVDAWIRPVSNGRLQTVMSRWDFPSEDDSSRTFNLTMLANGELTWSIDETSSRRPDEVRTDATALLDGAFHHVAATWSNGLLSIYVDGALRASRSSLGGSLNPAASTAFIVGGKAGRGSPSFFAGTIDEPTVWSRALNQAEVASIAAAGSLGRC